MVHMLVSEGVTQEKVWNVVDWLITGGIEGVDSSLGIVINIVGAFLCMIVPYLLGSIQPTYLFCKLARRSDIRKLGTESADVDNVWGLYGKGAAIVTLLLEFLVATAAVWFGRLIWESNGGALAGFFVILGTMIPFFHRMKGGKGMVCLAFVVLNLNWLSFLILLLIYILCLLASRMTTFAAVLTAFLYPLILNAFAPVGLNAAMAVFTTGIIVFAYRKNLKRMSEGQEPRISFSRKPKE